MSRWLCVSTASFLSTSFLLSLSLQAAEISFNKDIRPLLVEHCFACHGADSAARKAELRLDRRDDAVEHGAIVPGDVDSTVMLDRIYSDDPEEVMPPPSTKKPRDLKRRGLLPLMKPIAARLLVGFHSI